MTINLTRAGYEVVHAPNGREALDQIQQQTPDLIIADIWMPEMDGLQFLKIVKGMPQTSSVPVIIVTGAGTQPKDVAQGMSLGAFAYLKKPFENEDLLDAVKMALSGDSSN